MRTALSGSVRERDTASEKVLAGTVDFQPIAFWAPVTNTVVDGNPTRDFKLTQTHAN
jgi:hypothetical protein